MKRLIPYWLRIEIRRAHRWLMLLPKRGNFAHTKMTDEAGFPFEIVSHSSKLMRKVPSEWLTLQQNKIRNLEIACEQLNGLLIEPDAIFSFCHAVGRTSRRKGYLDGLEMHNGILIGAPGGGLCQLANRIFWMALHLDLHIVERHRHDMDLFPDDERHVPFGMGATVFYNYRDLQIRNTSGQPLLLKVLVEPPLLKGALLSASGKPFEIEIFETLDHFVRAADESIWRENRVWKRVTYKDGRPSVEAEIAHNLGRACYEVPREKIDEGESSERGFDVTNRDASGEMSPSGNARIRRAERARVELWG